MHELRKKLLRNSEFNPFNDSYNSELVLKEAKTYIENNTETDEEIKLIETYLSTEHLNDHFKDAYQYLRKTLFKSNLTIEEVIKFSISHVNRQYLLVRNEMFQSLANKKEIKYNEAYGHKIPSIDPTIGEVDSVLAVEGMVDALNLLCNYVKYFTKEIPEKRLGVDEIKSIEAIKRLNMASNYFDVLKGEYDNCIWNDGYVTFDRQTNRIDFRYFNPGNLFLKKIGFYRLQKNVSGFNLIMKQKIDNDKVFVELLKKHYRIKKQSKRIKSISINDGYITYKLASGEDKHEFEEELRIDNEFATYYNFLEDAKMPQLNDMSLNDVIKLFSLTQQLIRKTSYLKIGDDSIHQLIEFGKFAYRIKVEDLKSYLGLRTTYSKKQINEFLNLLTCPENSRVNFWDYPLLKIQDDFVFPLISLTSPITTVLADRWLEDGGFNLDERGFLFEKYIKETLKESLTEKGYIFQIPENEILTNSKGKWEEIDLILNLKNICLIAEVKCIKFALDARNEHNAVNRLKKGAEQVIRKAKFIEDHSKDFINSIGVVTNKKILRVVITNYPIYTGYSLNGIPVIDFFMLDSFISAGKLSNQKQHMENGKFTKREVVNEKVFYNNEDEFCNYMEAFLNKPEHVYENMQFFKITENKITPEFMEVDMFVEAVDYK